jgi:hypothetical protein
MSLSEIWPGIISLLSFLMYDQLMEEIPGIEFRCFDPFRMVGMGGELPE